MNPAENELRECAEHALVEMRDRFGLNRGDSISLDALEDALCLPVVGFYLFTEAPIPPPHSNTICFGCEACKVRAAKGLPLYV